MDVQQRVIKIIKRPLDFDVKYLHLSNTNRFINRAEKPRFRYEKDELLEFWWTSWRNYRTLKGNLRVAPKINVITISQMD